MLLNAGITSTHGNDVKRVAMKAMGFCVLLVVLSLADGGGISDALSAAGPRLPQTAPPPSIAATPPSHAPAGGAAPDAPAGSPRNPNSTPMPAPASTNHYAGYPGAAVMRSTRSQSNEANPGDLS